MTEPALQLISTCVDDTLALGRAIGTVLRPGDVVALVGELGVGKTHLVKGIAEGLGVADRRAVNSPTFTLVNEYPGRHRLFHLDAYRLNSVAEFAALGLDEMVAQGVVVVEWADRVKGAIEPDALWIEMSTVGENWRRIRVVAASPSLLGRLESVRMPALQTGSAGTTDTARGD